MSAAIFILLFILMTAAIGLVTYIFTLQETRALSDK